MLKCKKSNLQQWVAAAIISLLIITPTACCFSTHSLFTFHVFCEFIPIRGPCAPHYALKLNRDIKYLCSKQYLQFDPYSCLTITDRLLGFGGTLILKSSLLPSNLFCQLGAIVTSVCQGTDFQATLLDLCFCFSFRLPLCCPWCCSVVQYDWECISP